MKILLITAIVALTTGCYGSQMSQMDNRMAQMERENTSLRRQNAQMRKQGSVQPSASTPTPVAMPTRAPVAPAARAWTRRSHGQYVCIVDYDAHISLADRVRFENKVDNRYGITKSRNNSWVSISLNGQPVAIVRSTFRGPAVQYHLGPNETCYVELGGATNYKVIGALHKNKGTYHAPVLVDTHRKMTRSWDMGPDDDELPFVFQKYQF